MKKIEEVYDWIESNCLLSDGVHPVLNAVQRDMLSKLFSDDVYVVKLCNRQDGITSCYVWYLAYLITHLDMDMHIGILVRNCNAGQHFFHNLKEELALQELDGLKVLEFSHKVIKYENGGHKITIRLIVSKNDYVGNTFDIILCDGWTWRTNGVLIMFVMFIYPIVRVDMELKD